MKKFGTFAVAALLVTALSVSASAANTFKAATGTPTIDGKMDDAYKAAQEIAINLMEKCGFTMPFSESALNTIHNICSKNVNYNIDYSDVCF